MYMQIVKRWLSSITNAFQYDFCPGANPFFYGLKQPIGWVFCAIAASLLVGLFVGPQGFVLAGGFVALLIFGVAWPLLCIKGLRCELEFDQSRSVEGEPTHVTLEVTNRFPIPAFGLMIQGKFLQDLNHEDDVIAVGLRHVPGWSVSKFQWPLVPNFRGELPTEPPSLVTGFPFGLYRLSKPVQIVGRTIVWPKTNEQPIQVKTIGTQFAINATADRQAGNDGETIGVRDYRYGDSVRNIHWSHTARHNRLILRERQSRTQTTMRVVLDLMPDHHLGTGSRSTYENAIRLAASVCSELHRHQFQIDLRCIGLAAGVPFQTNNHGGVKEMFDFLARLPTLEASPALTPSTRPGRCAVETAIQSHRSFTFLIHTDIYIPDVDASRVSCLCVESESDAKPEIQTAPHPLKRPSNPTIAVPLAPANSDLGAPCVPT